MDERTRVVQSGYDAIAERYHAGRAAREAVNVAWLDGLRPLLPASGDVLDLGCGSGVPITKYFAERGLAVTGVDVSPAMLALARRHVPAATFVEATIEQFVRLGSAPPDFRFDLIVSFFAIIHVDRSLHEALFVRLADILNPSGKLLLSLGVDDNPDQHDDFYGAPMTWSHFDAATNLRMLADAGFHIDWHEVEDLPGERHLFLVATKDR
ncbi:MAG TPA: class I SAM-dependent methyltransferase [Fimbriimonadaceae bacterium]|nr:class I SAM-dependent methyltransferase [Fimbriimonadaceae bacterium]